MDLTREKGNEADQWRNNSLLWWLYGDVMIWENEYNAQKSMYDSKARTREKLGMMISWISLEIFMEMLMEYIVDIVMEMVEQTFLIWYVCYGHLFLYKRPHCTLLYNDKIGRLI